MSLARRSMSMAGVLRWFDVAVPDGAVKIWPSVLQPTKLELVIDRAATVDAERA
jgi:hypothetical protein